MASPRTADGRPPPALIPTPPPRPAPPLSPPSQAVSPTPDTVAPPIIAAPAPAPAPAAVAKAPAPPPPVSKAEAAPPKPTPEQKPAVKAPPPPPSSKTERVVRYASTEVNVRPRPSQNARRIDILDEGMAVEVIGPLIDDKWAKVSRHGEVLGYVAAEFLRKTPPPPH